MRSLTAGKCPGVVIGVFAACLALAAQGSPNVFNDAVFWFRGGKDLDGDGYMKQGEFFDDLNAFDDSNPNHQMIMSSAGYYEQDQYATLRAKWKANAKFQPEQVVFPALGTSVTRKMQVLHVSDIGVLQNTRTWYYPFSVNPRSLFTRYSISNEYTIVSRIRLENLERVNYIFKIGYSESNKQGLKLGFMQHPVSQYAGTYKCLGGYCSPSLDAKISGFQLRDLRIPTNTWVDVAVVVGDGVLRVGIAEPQSLASNNPSIGFATTDMWTDNCQLLDSDESYCLFCPDNISTYAQTDKECFLGSVQQMAIWKRALSDQEVMEAFGMPRPAIFRAGFDNGSSNEFGGKRSDRSTQTIDGLGAWQGVWDEMQAGDTWTVNFNAMRDEAGLPQIFSIKSLSDSDVAQIEPILTNASHNTSLGERRVAADGRTFWPVPADLIAEGVNTLIIKRKNDGAGTFRVDAMELGGSLGVGKANHTIDDERVYPERIATGVPSAADPNPSHWPVGFRPYQNDNTNLHFRVWVDPDVVGACTSRFWTCANRFQRDDYTVEGPEAFTIYVNGEDRGSYMASNSWENVSIGFEKGDLRGGWNDFEIRSAAYDTCHWLFDRFRFETVLQRSFSLPPLGLSIILR